MYSKCHKRCFCYFYGFQTNNVIQNSHIVFGCSHNNICFMLLSPFFYPACEPGPGAIPDSSIARAAFCFSSWSL